MSFVSRLEVHVLPNIDIDSCGVFERHYLRNVLSALRSLNPCLQDHTELWIMSGLDADTAALHAVDGHDAVTHINRINFLFTPSPLLLP
jgi:hypothetical protein